MGFWDVVAPAWTNAYREGELQQIEMGKQASLLSQSPYYRAWAENNPDSPLVRHVNHIMSLPRVGGTVAYQGTGVPQPGQPGGPPGPPAPTPDMGSDAWRSARTPYQPPPPPPLADQPGGGGGAVVYPTQQSQPIATPRLIGPTGPSAYRYPQTADTPENVSMESNKAQTSLHAAEEALKWQQVRRLQSMGTGGGARPGYTMKGYSVDENGNIRENYEKIDPNEMVTVPEGTLPRQKGAPTGKPTGPGLDASGRPARALPPPSATGAPTGQPAGKPAPTAPATPPAKAGTPSAAAIPQPTIDQDRQMFGLTPTGQPGQSGTPAPSPAPGAPPGATPPPAGAPGAAPPGSVPVTTGVPPGAVPVSGPLASAPQMVDAFGQPVDYTAPYAPATGGGSGQVGPGGKLYVEKPPTVTPERLAALDVISTHNPLVRKSIEQYGRARAATIGQNAELIDRYLEAKKATARGAPSLQGQIAHLGSSIQVVNYLGQDIQMPTHYADGTPVEPEFAGKRVSPYTVLTKSPMYAAFGKRVPVLGQIFGPGLFLDMQAGKGDPRAVAMQSYAGAVQSIVKGLGDVGNLSEGEQKTVTDKLLPGENTTVYEAPLKQRQLLGLLTTIYQDLLKARGSGGTNVDGANAVRRGLGLPQIDAWSVDRDNSRQGIQAAPNVIAPQPQGEPNTIGPAE